MNTTDKRRLIEEVKDLVDLPGIERIVYHRIHEIKSGISKGETDHYLKVQGSTIKSREILLTDAGELEFHLYSFGKTLWIPHIPGIESNPYDYLPDELIYFIVEKAVSDIIGIERNLFFHGIPGRIFNLSFERVEARKIQGTIEVNQCGADHEGPIIYPREQEPIADRAASILELFHYMFNDDSLYNRIMNEFRKGWRPFIDESKAR